MKLRREDFRCKISVLKDVRFKQNFSERVSDLSLESNNTQIYTLIKNLGRKIEYRI